MHDAPAPSRVPAGRAAPRRARTGALALGLAALLALAPAGVADAAPGTGTASTTGAAADAGDVTWGLLPADDDELGADRANFAYTVAPGDTITDTVVVTNRSARVLELRTYAADAFTTTSGQLDLLPAGETSTDLGSWVTLEATSVTVDPGQSLDVPFTVVVPPDARPGDHSAGIITSLVQEASASTVALDNRLALRMHLRVDGALAPALTVSDVRVVHHGSVNPVGTSTATVRYTLTNTGNARVLPVEQVTVEGPFGGARAGADADELAELLPGSALEREVVVAGVRPLGRATAHVGVTATAVGIGGGATASATGDATTWAVPWAALAVLVLAVAGALRGPAVVAAVRARARRDPGPSAGPGPGAQAPASAPTGPSVAELEAALERARAAERAARTP